MQKDVMKAHSGEISKISKEKEQSNKKIANADLQIQQLNHDIKNCDDNYEDCIKKVLYLFNFSETCLINSATKLPS